jgi:hypothetical protein
MRTYFGVESVGEDVVELRKEYAKLLAENAELKDTLARMVYSLSWFYPMFNMHRP